MPRRREDLFFWEREALYESDCHSDVPLTATRRAQIHSDNDYFPIEYRSTYVERDPKPSMLTAQVMDPIAVKVARRYRAGVDALTRPGVHDYDLSAGGIGFTLTMTVPDPASAERRSRIHAEIAIDRSVYERPEDVQDYEDGMLAAVTRFLGRRVRWIEGDWSRGSENTWTRQITVPTFGRKF